MTKEDCDNKLFQVFDHQDDGRLKAHKISKQLINRLQPKTRDLSIQELCKIAKLKNKCTTRKRAHLPMWVIPCFLDSTICYCLTTVG